MDSFCISESNNRTELLLKKAIRLTTNSSYTALELGITRLNNGLDRLIHLTVSLP